MPVSESAPVRHLKLLLDNIGDPRHPRGCRHRFSDILFIALVAMVAGADDAEAIEDFGNTHEAWFRRHLELPHGIPSQDTFLRLFAAIRPEAFQDAFRQWTAALRPATDDRPHIALDGKTLRGSFDTATGQPPLHLVSAWLADAGLVLGQLRVAEKANEIVALPELLRLLDLREALVTIDAIGCQRAIAEQIVEAGGDYVLAVKENQPALAKDLRDFFDDARRETRPASESAPVLEVFREADAGHGRVEERTCFLSRDLSWVSTREAWMNLSAIALVVSVRHDKQTGATSREERMYITNDAKLSAAELVRTVRGHWSIENQLHWVLDMTFHEDASRIRTGNAAANFALVRQAALNLLKAMKDKLSLTRRRRKCGWSTDYLETVLTGQPKP